MEPISTENEMAPAANAPTTAIPVLPPDAVDAPLAPLDPDARTGRKLWHVGTLTYTAGGLAVLFCWLLWGDFAWSIKERSVGPVVQLLLIKFGASDLLLGLLLVSLPQFIAMILGPIVSYKSDRHRGRFGRRVPFLLIPTPVALLALVGLAFAPALGHAAHGVMGVRSPGHDRSVLVFLGLFWGLFEVSMITANSVFGAFVNDVVPRPVLGTFYGLFRAVSLIAGMIFNTWFFGKASVHYTAIFLGCALLFGLGFTAMCFNVKEGEYPPPPPDEGAGSPLLVAGGYLRECFTKPYYLWVFAAVVLPNLAFLPINTYNLKFSQSVNMSNDAYGKLMAFYFFLSLLQTVPIGWLADKFHPLRMAMVGLVLHGLASLWGALAIHDARTFGIAYVLTGTLSGTWFTATAAMTQLLLPKMKFAQYASALGIVSCIGMMVIGPAVGRVLDLTHHQYRYTYLAGFLFDAAGLVVTIIVFQKFLALGGARHYVAPE